ncbi:MAG: bifunctional nuclease domain-containing protein [Ignavibacteriaceae bacterium]
MQKIQCEILGLSSSPSTGGAYAILLKEINGNRRLPIIIGAFEAQAIALEIEGIKPPRPLTHDLLKQVLDNLGAAVMEVVIDELRENTFYAKIILEVSALASEVDARPSDAIALAVRTQSPIYVAEKVMEAAAFLPSEESGKEEGLSHESSVNEKEDVPKTKEAKIASLQNKLKDAIAAEEYEKAAKLRDDIQRLTNTN